MEPALGWFAYDSTPTIGVMLKWLDRGAHRTSPPRPRAEDRVLRSGWSFTNRSEPALKPAAGTMPFAVEWFGG